jgi:peptidoglycan/LPS O-acetylase OafA/YrhL
VTENEDKFERTHDTMQLTRATHRAPHLTHVVDNADWLKTAAIISVAAGHFGFFFVEDDRWWSVFGRLAAPIFFFLLGYAQSRTVPHRWIWLGIILTLLESWNAHWTWVSPNILLSLALIRLARPYVKTLVQRHGWAAFALLVFALLMLLPIGEKIADYGSEGWLWALFGLFQRMYVDGKSATDADGAAQGSAPTAQTMAEKVSRMRLLACFIAAVVYLWQEQREYSFPRIHFAVFILEVCVLSLSLCLFRRGPSRIQPPEVIAVPLRFIGRRTLEIYAIQLGGSELLVKLFPGLAP